MKNKKDRGPGRPTIYKPEYAQMLIDYFNEPPYKKVKKQIVTGKGDVVEIDSIEANDFKTLAGFAISIGVSKRALLDWIDVHEDFLRAYNRVKDFQEAYLATNGNKGLLQANFAIFTAKNVIDWRDKRDVELKGTVQSVADDQLDARIKELEEKLKR